MVDYFGGIAIGISMLAVLAYYLQLRKMPYNLTNNMRIERLETDVKSLSHKVSSLEDNNTTESSRLNSIDISLAKISNDIGWIKSRMGKEQ